MKLPLPFTLLVALGDVDNKVFHAGTAWIPIDQLQFVRAQFEQMASQTNFRAVFAYQVSNDPHVPGAATDVGTALTTDGPNFTAKVDILSALAGYRFVRFGWRVWYNVGGTPPLFGRCGGDAELWRIPG